MLVLLITSIHLNGLETYLQMINHKPLLILMLVCPNSYQDHDKLTTTAKMFYVICFRPIFPNSAFKRYHIIRLMIVNFSRLLIVYTSSSEVPLLCNENKNLLWMLSFILLISAFLCRFCDSIPRVQSCRRNNLPFMSPWPRDQSKSFRDALLYFLNVCANKKSNKRDV